MSRIHPYKRASTTSDLTIRAFRGSRLAFGRLYSVPACMYDHTYSKSMDDRLLIFVYFQVNNGVLYCFWIMKILVIMVLCSARFNYCIVFVFIV